MPQLQVWLKTRSCQSICKTRRAGGAAHFPCFEPSMSSRTEQTGSAPAGLTALIMAFSVPLASNVVFFRACTITTNLMFKQLLNYLFNASVVWAVKDRAVSCIAWNSWGDQKRHMHVHWL
jgi:hypothetical protein